MDTQLAGQHFDVLQSEIRERQEAADKLREGIENSCAIVLRCEDEISALRERLSELEHQMAATQQRGLDLKNESDLHESRILFNGERLREVAAHNTKAIADRTHAQERRRAAEQGLECVQPHVACSQSA